MSKRNKIETETTGGFKLARTLLKFIKDEKTKKLVKTLIVAAIALFAGFFAGRKTITTGGGSEIVYLPGDTLKVEIEVDRPVPVEVKKPIDTLDVIADCIRNGKYFELFPERVRDSIVYVTKEDTAAVIADWATERIYEQKIFEIDTVGMATVRAKTQYNRISWLSTTFVPVIKETTVTNVVAKKYSPFFGGGITTMPEVVVNGGIYFDDKYGASVLYEYNWNLKKHAVGVMGTVKF